MRLAPGSLALDPHLDARPAVLREPAFWLALVLPLVVMFSAAFMLGQAMTTLEFADTTVPAVTAPKPLPTGRGHHVARPPVVAATVARDTPTREALTMLCLGKPLTTAANALMLLICGTGTVAAGGVLVRVCGGENASDLPTWHERSSCRVLGILAKLGLAFSLAVFWLASVNEPAAHDLVAVRAARSYTVSLGQFTASVDAAVPGASGLSKPVRFTVSREDGQTLWNELTSPAAK